VRAVAEIEILAVAPGWSKFAGARLADLSSDDLRDLHRQARAVTFRLAIERELRRRTRSCRSRSAALARCSASAAAASRRRRSISSRCRRCT
jgi:hypothetical protein